MGRHCDALPSQLLTYRAGLTSRRAPTQVRHSPSELTRRRCLLNARRWQGWWCSHNAYLTFEDVRVPASNLIGQEGEGFKYIMLNFNGGARLRPGDAWAEVENARLLTERFSMACMVNRYARVCLEDAIEFARKRKTFGKRLIDHQAQSPVADGLPRGVQPAELRRPRRTGCPAQGGGNGAADRGQPQLPRERRLPHAGEPHGGPGLPVLPARGWSGAQSGVSDIRLGGILSLLKVQCTKTLEFCARCGPRFFRPRASPAERLRP